MNDEHGGHRARLPQSLHRFAERVSGQRAIAALTVLYLLVAGALTVHDFRVERDREYHRLDATLRAASFALDQILGPDFHDRYDSLHPVPAPEYRRILLELNRFSRLLGLEYVYSMTRRDSTIRFVVSNETRDDTLRGTPSAFDNPYPHPPEELHRAFDGDSATSVLYASYTNLWNSYYSVFVPRTSPGGHRYVLAADVKLKDQQAIFWRCLRRDGLLVLALLLPLVPLLVAQRSLLSTREAMARRDRAHVEELRAANDRLEEAVEERTAELARAVEDLRRFSYAVSHDLRSPLHAISGFAQILREDLGKSASAEDMDNLERILAASSRMASLIETQLSLAAHPATALERTDVDVSELAREVVAELEASDAVRHADVAIADGIRAFADPVLVRALLQNLLGNAIKYSAHRPDPRVALAGGTDSDTDWFEISDNGEGFDDARAAALFEPFARLHEGEVEGFGVGLANVARIVERHGGAVRAEGRPGEGAVFRVSLPRRPAA